VPWVLYLTPFVISAALTAATGGYAWSLRDRIPSARAFAALQFLECAWTILFIGELLAPTTRSKFLLDRLQYVPMSLASVACLAFALRYAGRASPRARAIWGALALVPAPFVAWALVGAVSRPLPPSARIEPIPPFGSLLYDFDGVDGVIIGQTLILVTLAVAVFLGAFGRQHRVHRRQTVLVAFGIALPTVGAVGALALGVYYLGQRNVTPALFGLSAAITAWALFSRRVLDLVPVARDAIVENLPDAVIVLDGRERVVEANQAAARFLLVAPEEAIGRPAREVISGWPELARVLGGSAEGSRITLESSGFDVRTSVIGPTDRPVGRTIVLRDITPVHRANVALREARESLERRVADRTRDLQESNEWLQREVTERAAAEASQRETARQLQALFDNVFQLIKLVAPDGTILAANRTALEFGGVESADVVGRRLWETVWWAHDPAQAARLRDGVREAAAGTAVRFAATHRRRDGRVREMDFSLKPVRDSQGRVSVLVGASHDLTDLRSAERERRALEERLERSHRIEAIGRFAAGIGHDFNNLLTVIVANAKIVRSEAAEGSEVAEMLDDLVEAADEAGKLTQQLLALSSRQRVHPVPVALGPALDGIRRLAAPVLGDRVAFRGDASAAAPAWVDPRQLEQIVVSLAARARDVLPGGGTFEVDARDATLDDVAARAHGVEPGRWVVLTVRDDGEAVSEEAQRHLFEPFHTAASGAHGGLGLATVHGAVSRSGGFIEVRSGPGRGTAFEIWLPSAAGRAPPRAAVEEAPAGRGEQLMIVEDLEPVRLATARILAKLGYRVRAFGSGADALAAMADGEPVDLLVTDVQMPDMSGPVLASTARGRRPGLRVLYVSGLLDDGDPDVERARDDASFLSKPFTPAALADAVRRALRARPGGHAGESAPPAG
jgi:two-component system cell cycle sensor histidine kinase/response regulator CckA